MKAESRDWIYLTKHDPFWRMEELSPAEKERQQEYIQAVREAVSKLPEVERTIIERYYFDGLTFIAIASELGRCKSKIEYLHQQSLRQLRKLLAPFAREKFGIETKEHSCSICISPHRKQIDQLIKEKKPEESFRTLISRIKTNYGISIISPQTIVGHIKYHS